MQILQTFPVLNKNTLIKSERALNWAAGVPHCSLWDRHSEFPVIATSRSVPRGDLFCRHGQENQPPREAEGGGPRGGHQVGWKGGTLLPGSPNISQPVGSVCSLNSGGVCDPCEVTCLLSLCTVKAARPHSHCTDTNPTLLGGSITRAEHTGALGRACSALCPHKPSRDVNLHTLSSPHSNTWSPPELLPRAKGPPSLLPCSMKFLFSRPDFSRNPWISYFIA